MNFFPKKDLDILNKEFENVARCSAIRGVDSVSVLIFDKSHFVDIDYYHPGCYGIRHLGDDTGQEQLRFETLDAVVSFIREYENKHSS